ncbi:MAG TPA: DUF222 domain-containing protein [Steroidobacteraceae bacterium]|nr:DUF222 domain-containing protein [Steroidobacteraceae bacterium]
MEENALSGTIAAPLLEPHAGPVNPRQSLRDLEAQITELTGHLNAATYYWLTLIAEFDRREGWGGDGATRSCAHWLNWKCGIDLGAARERVRVAHALEKLPRISAAMREGRLSYSKVRAITRVASEATEEVFLQIAIYGTAHHVEKLVRVFRRAKEAEELSREAQQQERRSVMWLHEPDGSLVIKATLPAEAGALFIKAMETALEAAPATMTAAEKDVSAARSSGYLTVSSDAERLAHRRADAFARITESYLKHGQEELSASERQQIVVHVDVQTLRNSTAGRCELEDGPSLPAETVRRLACDASLVTIIESEQGEPLSVGRKTRAISPALRRVLNARDRGCRFPGCPNTRYVDAHHIRHWAHGGETKPSNLISLCRFHHRQVHEGRVVIDILDDGALSFRKPTGESFESVALEHSLPLASWQGLIADNRRRGLAIEPNTAATRWMGEAMDFQIAIDSLLFRERRAARVSAEMPDRIEPGVIAAPVSAETPGKIQMDIIAAPVSAETPGKFRTDTIAARIGRSG